MSSRVKTKIGRNDRCPCGSGKKYKKCHGFGNRVPIVTKVEPTHELDEMMKAIEKENEERRVKFLEPLGIYIDFVKPTVMQGNKFWVLGDRLYYERPPNETFHQFIIFILCQTLGADWEKEQLALPENDRHFIYRCHTKYREWCGRNQTRENYENGKYRAFPDGWTKALLTLAFDVASLVHREHLPDQLLNRLKNRDQYQGARYEITIAAMFARMGYKIEFLDEQGITTTHPEFIAVDRITGEEIAVEVKSKTREGVLHTPGDIEQNNKLYWGNVQRLRRQALTQNPGDKPFLVFIDMNTPQMPGLPPEEKPWIKDIQKIFNKAPKFSPENLDPCSGEIFTNYSYHYQTENEALSGEHLYTIPLFSKFPIKRENFFTRLITALNNYGRVPDLDIDIRT